ALPGTEIPPQGIPKQDRRNIGEIQGEQEKEQQMEDQEAQRGLTTANTNKVNAETAAAGQPKPKEENWGEFAGFTDKDGTPLIREQNSGQVVRASDKKPPTGFMAAKQPTDKPDSPEQQFLDEYTRTHKGASIAEAESAYARTTQKPEHDPRQMIVGP